MELRGKVALVTGGAVRVGRAVALALAAAGTDIVLNYHSSEDSARATAAEIEALGRRVLPHRADIANVAAVEAMVAKAVDHFGRLDVLINSASFWRRTPFGTVDEAAWDSIVDVTLKGSFFAAQAAAPHLAANDDGLIVNILDVSVFRPFPNLAPHSAAKAGLLNLTYALAAELAPAVRVNAIAPGPILAPPGYSPALLEATARRTVLGRWGSPGDVGQAVLYLASAGYVTGTLIPVDGGEHLGVHSRNS